MIRLALLLALANLALAGVADAGPPMPVLEVELVEAAGGGPAAGDAYVAVVIGADRLATPVAERVVVLAGEPVRFEIPPGDYRPFCAVAGRAPVLGPAVGVAGDAVARVRCAVAPLVELTGRVIQESTLAPVPGTTVRPLWLDRAVAEDVLSALGAQSITPKLSAETGRDGSFRLPVEPGRELDLVVRAPAMAEVLLEAVRPGAEGGRIPDVALAPGGALAVRIGLPLGWEPERVTAFADRFLPGSGFKGVSSRPERRLWQRVPDPSGSVEWHGLPTGLFGLAAGIDDGDPIPIGYAVIRPGSFEWLEIGLADVEVELIVAGLPQDRPKELSLTLANDSLVAAEPAGGEPPADGTRFSARLTLAGGWQCWLDSHGEAGMRAYSYLGTFEVDGGEPRISIGFEADLEPLGGVVVTEEGRPAAGAEVIAGDRWTSALYGCRTTTDEGGRWTCPVYGGQQVVVIARHDQLGVSQLVTVAAGETAAAERLVLREGRQLEGTLGVPFGEWAGDARVGFALDDAPGLGFLTQTDDEGRFAFGHLPPGAGVVAARPTARGLSVAAAPIPEEGDVSGKELTATAGAIAIAPGPTGGRQPVGPLGTLLETGGVKLSPALVAGVLRQPGCWAPGVACRLERLLPGPVRVGWVDPRGSLVASAPAFRVAEGDLVVFSTGED